MLFSYHFSFSNIYMIFFWFSFFQSEGTGWRRTFKSVAVICMKKCVCFLKKSVSWLYSHTWFISTLNRVLLALRVKHAQSITRPITSCWPRTVAGGFAHSVYMKRQYRVVAESAGCSCVSLGRYLTSLSLHVRTCGRGMTIHKVITYKLHMEGS